MSRIFISYAHGDGREPALRMSELLAAEGHDPWLDRERLSAGAGWTEEIERAIDAADVVLALLSHAAYQSDICRAEQLRALRRGKRVLPILLQPDADRPIHLESRQFADLSGSRDYWEVLELLEKGEGAVLPARYRKERVTRPGFSFTPIARPRELDRLRRALIREQPDQRICLTALRGMGGVGKTVLSALVFDEPAVRDAFPDGRIWLTIGQSPSDAHLLAQLREVPRVLGESLENYESLTSAANELRTTLRDPTDHGFVRYAWSCLQSRAVGGLLAPSDRCGEEAGWGLTAVDHAIRYWDLETNEIVAVLEGHEGRVNWLEFSPDSQWAYSAAADATIRVWDLAEERLHSTVHLGWPVSQFALHADLRHVVGLRSGGGLVLIDLQAADPIRTALDFDAPIHAFAYSPRLQVAMLADAADVVHFVQVHL